MPKKRSAVLLILVLGTTYLLYVSALGFPFVYDDQAQIVQNPHLSAWSYMPVYFTQDVWSHLSGPRVMLYRPLFLIWLRLNVVFFGHNSTWWHLTTLLLHLMATGLIYVLARKLLHDTWTALAAALLFGIHPVHVEGVAWISGVTEPLSAVLVLGAFLCYLRSSPGRPQSVSFWRAMSLGLFALGILAKETAAMLPLLVFLYELTTAPQPFLQANETEARTAATSSFSGLRARAPFGRALQRSVLFFVLVGGYLAARAMALGALLHKGNEIPLSAGLLRWPWLLCSYARVLVWPAHLSPLYDPISVNGLSDVRFWLPAVFLLAGGFALWRYRNRIGPTTFFLSGWFLVTVAPALVISCVARPWELFQDRYAYMPSVAFVIAAAAGLRWLLQRGNKPVKIATAALGAVAVLALAIASWKQIRYWQSNYALFNRASTIAPHNELAKLNFVPELIKYKEYAKALHLAEEAILLSPESARAQDSAAWAAFYLKDYALAEQHWSAATRMDGHEARTWQYLGLSRMQLGDYEGAAAALEQAITLDPQGLGLHYSRGRALAQSNQWTAAEEEFRQELALAPENQQALVAYHDAASHAAR